MGAPIQFSLRTLVLFVVVLGLSTSIHKSLGLSLAMAVDGLAVFLSYLLAVSYLEKRPVVAEHIIQFTALFVIISSIMLILVAQRTGR